MSILDLIIGRVHQHSELPGISSKGRVPCLLPSCDVRSCRIPWTHLERLSAIYVLHPDIVLQLAMCLWVRWWTPELWEKVHYLHRLEDLKEHFPDVSDRLPSFVKDHDQELGEHPLMDYGFITVNEAEAMNDQLPSYT